MSVNSNVSQAGKMSLRTDISAVIRIPKYFLLLIDYYHEQAPGREWSGLLCYKEVSGNLQSDSIILEITDLFVGDVGSGTFTTWDANDFITEKNISLISESKFGSFHTHHSMDSFFSGTDNNDLLENAGRYNEPSDYYVSVIFNKKSPDNWKARLAKAVSKSYTKTITKTKITWQELLQNNSWIKNNAEKDSETETIDVNFNELVYIDAVFEVIDGNQPSMDWLFDKMKEFSKALNKSRTTSTNTTNYYNYNKPHTSTASTPASNIKTVNATMLELEKVYDKIKEGSVIELVKGDDKKRLKAFNTIHNIFYTEVKDIWFSWEVNQYYQLNACLNNFLHVKKLDNWVEECEILNFLIDVINHMINYKKEEMESSLTNHQNMKQFGHINRNNNWNIYER